MLMVMGLDDRKSKMGTAGFVLGTISSNLSFFSLVFTIIFFFKGSGYLALAFVCPGSIPVSLLALFTGIFGTIFSAVSLRRAKKGKHTQTTTAISGLVLSIIGLVLMLLIIVFIFVYFSIHPILI